MTPLFCVDITENRNNDRINGCDTELLVQKTSDLLSSSRDRLLLSGRKRWRATPGCPPSWSSSGICAPY